MSSYNPDTYGNQEWPARAGRQHDDHLGGAWQGQGQSNSITDARPSTTLRILSTTDLHMHIFPYDYYADAPSDAVGLARTATLIAEAQAEVANCLLFDNGDFLQGNPMGDLVAQRPHKGQIHPMIAAMNLIGYDAVSVGNHDFNFGLPFLFNALKGATFPCVCSNLERVDPSIGLETDNPLRPSLLLHRKLRLSDGSDRDVRIGVLGFVPPQVNQWDRLHFGGQVRARGIVCAAQDMVPLMKAAGADLVIVLAHSGIGAPEPQPLMENAATALAAVPGIDAVIAGHSHLVFPSPHFEGMRDVDVAAGLISGKPAVMAGFWGSHLGVIDMTLEWHQGHWRVAASHSEARPVLGRDTGLSGSRGRPHALKVLNVAAQDHSATLAHLRRPIGKTVIPLSTYFALVAPTACTRIVADAQRRYVASRLQGGTHAALPLLSAASPFKAGGRGGAGHYTDIPKGELALRHLCDLYLFPNTIRALRVTGLQLADWLERSAGLFRQIIPGLQDQLLINPDFPCYNFDTIYGVTYQIDLSQPSRFDLEGRLINPDAQRIRNLSLDGQIVQPDAEFVVATNSYRAAGGGGFPGVACPSQVVLESKTANRDIVIDHVHQNQPLTEACDVPWTFAPLPGTSVLFDTAPSAQAHLDEVDLRIEAAGPAQDGFVRFRIRL